MTVSKLYRGFSTANYLKQRSFKLYDIDLVKEDITNHIYTSLGERVYLTSFGTTIPDMAFEQLDQSSINIIREDITRVIKYDPRVSLQQLIVQPDYDRNTLIVSAQVLYVELNMTGTIDLHLEFDQF